MEILEKDIRQIVALAVRAPSGDNLQPWRFVCTGNTLQIFNVQRNDSIYNFKLRGSLVAHGALIENMVIAGSHFGYVSHVSLFPDTGNEEHIANVVLEKGAVEPDPLYEVINKRTTNRKKYLGTPLTPEQKNRALQAPRGLDCFGEVRVVDDLNKKREIAKLISTNEKLIFSNRTLHDNFYKEFRWSVDEVEKTKDGLDVRSLAMSFSDLVMIKIMKFWPLSLLFSQLGVASIIASKTSSIYRSAGAICPILVKSDSREDFLCGGRIMQRLWLEATAMGLSVQPTFGFILLGQRVEAGEGEMFSPSQIQLIEESYEKIKAVLGVKAETLAFMLRIGNGGEPRVYSLRKEPEIIFE